MLEAAATHKKSTPKKNKQPKFQFHVNKELQTQLKISTTKSYSTVTQQTPQEKQLTIVQPKQRLKQTNRQDQPPTQATVQTTQTTEETDNQQQDLNEYGI
jgi:hypothetical protein